MEAPMRRGPAALVLAATLALVVGCTPSSSDPERYAGPYPADHEALVRAEVAKRFLAPEAIRDARLSAPRPSRLYPAWLVCFDADAADRPGVPAGGRQVVEFLLHEGRVVGVNRGDAVRECREAPDLDHRPFAPAAG
jgi:hypothetical protein